jgi:hypothetical protein
MAKQFVFPGEVKLDAKPQIDAASMEQYRCALRLLAGQRIELVLRKPKSKRSIEMNAYLHCETGPFRLLAEHFGEDITGVKYALMGECFGWVYSEAAKREVPIKAHTSEMTTEESKYFVDWVIPWAAQNHGVLIPLPNEAL